MSRRDRGNYMRWAQRSSTGGMGADGRIKHRIMENSTRKFKKNSCSSSSSRSCRIKLIEVYGMQRILIMMVIMYLIR